MNKLIALILLVAAVSASGQAYKQRLPRPDEERKVAGVDWYLKDGPRFQVYAKFVGEGEIITLQPTNSILFCRSAGALTNCYINFPNPTNFPGIAYEIYAHGNVTVILSNTLNNVFTSITNANTSIYTVPTNSAVRVVSGRTNWYVIPGSK